MKLFGAAGCSAADSRGGDDREANVEFGRAAIAQCGFKLCAEDLGGQGHRNVILDVWSGSYGCARPRHASARA